ncbi:MULTISPECIES: shikimate dehydrogenase [unclassified Picosynechococcus]|nr:MULTISPECIES: shikimate dehydrogenase [unclassified Picosynechococcus]ACA99719.1 shikimate dehydrogenase [Picosynechococcus sp. PCC 7002]SMH56604.1 shikimate dehydrogenase [Picosynechococcus sp. OG1]SMQ83449.1 shikimate dehydrogenase [Synechococcus sp. 7002]
MKILGTTKLLGVIGDPVKHSFSPIMHNAAIAELGVDYVYLAFPVAAAALKAALDGFWAIDLQGFSITIPHKQAIMAHLEAIAPEAELVGAVNTVWRTETGWQGTNTDVAGFVAPLQALERDWSNVTPVILGNGGAARAVVVGCHQLGCPQIHVLGRDPEKLAQFSESWQNTPLAGKVQTHLWGDRQRLIPQAQLLINATPIGMFPKVDASPVSDELMANLPPGAIAYDLIYTPSPTQFLKQAQTQGAAIIDGSEMLVQQGAIALEKWLGQPVPVDTMRQALLNHLAR